MPSYRPLPLGKLQTWFGLQGQALAGGYFLFYTAGTTTPASVYGDEALTINNGSRIDLDSSGRTSVDVWASTANSFYVELYDSVGAKQGDMDNVGVPGGAAQTIPIPNSDEFLSGDGTNLLVVSLANKLLPDMAGNANKILGTDGSTPSWIAKPVDGAAGTSDIVIGSGSIKWSNGSSHVLKQWATDTVAGTGALEVSKSITFATAYSSAPKVDVQVTGSNASAASNVEVRWRISALSATGMTVVFSNRTGGSSADLSGNGVLTGTVSFGWEAIGPTAS
jgi:hypothetical protein